MQKTELTVTDPHDRKSSLLKSDNSRDGMNKTTKKATLILLVAILLSCICAFFISYASEVEYTKALFAVADDLKIGLVVSLIIAGIIRGIFRTRLKNKFNLVFSIVFLAYVLFFISSVLFAKYGAAPSKQTEIISSPASTEPTLALQVTKETGAVFMKADNRLRENNNSGRIA